MKKRKPKSRRVLRETHAPYGSEPAPLNTVHLRHCLDVLAAALARLKKAEPESMNHELLRNAAIKGFELSLETSGKLLRKALRAFMDSPLLTDELTFKDVLRHAGRYGLLMPDEIERWFEYRESRNTTAHDYGMAFAEETLRLLPSFLNDAGRLEQTLRIIPGLADD